MAKFDQIVSIVHVTLIAGQAVALVDTDGFGVIQTIYNYFST